ncbi:MAG: HU family DNA-binding protein, partial [Kiritimatiellae bacterium]|nr:HU family DNA-binding protein [Kiritimatiellia bacterium]
MNTDGEKLPSLTKDDLARAVSGALAVRRPEALAAVDAVLGAMKTALAEGRRCELRDFGIFSTVVHKARTGRNPRRPDD